MKSIIRLLFLLSYAFLFAQQKEFWMHDVATAKPVKVKDSAAAVKFLDSLSQNRYFLTRLTDVKLDGNKTQIFYDKGRNFNQGYVVVKDSLSVNKLSEKFFTRNIDSLKSAVNKQYLSRGFAFNRIQSKLTGWKDGYPEIELSLMLNYKRTIDGFVIRDYEKVPKRFVRNLEKEFNGKNYEPGNLEKITRIFAGHPYVALNRPPQTLFTKDSTKLYLFLQRKKSNTFDGVIGFGNDEAEKFTLNGTLNVDFRNIFNSFEQVSLYWQRSPDKGQTFDLKADVPYLFRTNIGAKLNVNIFRQDSTFATVKFLPTFYYQFNLRQKLGLRGTFESSSSLAIDTQNHDYAKKGIGIWYEYRKSSEIPLFIDDFRIEAQADYLRADYSDNAINASQTQYYLSGERNFHLFGNHYLNAKLQSAMLQSELDISGNELLRFGGWNSMRGFNENTLVADWYGFAGLEYRYLVGTQAFFDVFGQYGQLKNSVLDVRPSLYSYGLGFNFFVPLGLMSFQLSNGNQSGSPVKFGDIKIHWGILSRF